MAEQEEVMAALQAVGEADASGDDHVLIADLESVMVLPGQAEDVDQLAGEEETAKLQAAKGDLVNENHVADQEETAKLLAAKDDVANESHVADLVGGDAITGDLTVGVSELDPKTPRPSVPDAINVSVINLEPEEHENAETIDEEQVKEDHINEGHVSGESLNEDRGDKEQASTEQVCMDQSNNDQIGAQRETPDDADEETMAVDTPAERVPIQVPDDLLIGFGGKLALKESGKAVMQGRADIFEYIANFKAKRSLNSARIQPILAMLKKGGMSRERICREILSTLVEQFKAQILDLTQPQLTQILDKSYSYLTVPELRPVATLVLERLHHVDATTWQEIVDNGLSESPYVDLPPTLKRRIWTAVPSAFQFELNQLIHAMPEYTDPESIDDILAVQDRSRARQQNRVLQAFLRLVGASDDLLVMLVDRMVEVAAAAATTARRRTVANMFHDVLCVASRRRMPNLEKLRRMARHLDCGGGGANPEEAALGAAQVREIREGLSESASCGPVALLVSSVYTGDLVVSQLVSALIGQKKLLPPSRQASAEGFRKRAQELLRDPLLKDLTYICVSNMRAKALLAENEPLLDAHTAPYYAHFYPILCSEIAVDDQHMVDNFFRSNAREPHPALLQAAGRDAFERRVLIHYALVLLNRNNVVSVAKLRLVLDFALQRCDIGEEGKEAVIARGLITHVMDA